MTPERGYELAKYQRPGVKIVMGVTEAREEWMDPLPWWEFRNLPGFRTWIEYDLGFELSLWAWNFGLAAMILDYEMSVEEWKWLNGPATLIQAREWLVGILEEATHD